MNWKETLRVKWNLWDYNEELKSYTTCGNEIEIFISDLLKKQRAALKCIEDIVHFNKADYWKIEEIKKTIADLNASESEL